MDKYTTYVGMDVHARSITATALDKGTGETARKRFGLDCDVIAVSTLPRSAKDRQEKCDRLDSRAILREIANPLSGYSRVWVPTKAQEGAKEVCRAPERRVGPAVQRRATRDRPLDSPRGPSRTTDFPSNGKGDTALQSEDRNARGVTPHARM